MDQTALPTVSVMKQATQPYQTPSLRRSIWMLANTVVPYVLLFYAMVRSLEVSYWFTLLLAIPTGGFLIRTFIIFHDCCHGSFFQSTTANRITGILTGLITFTPFDTWKHSHATHHATAGDLDRRGVGDVTTMTVDEYLALTPLKRLGYRIYRHPITMVFFGSVLVFLVGHRLFPKHAGKRERSSVIWTNLALAGIVALLSWAMGFWNYLLVQVPIIVVGGSIGVWLFYVQHNFEGTYWVRHDQWQFIAAGLQGSSFYKLPKVLQWISGNIGFHHIHHLNPRIPNYNLEACQNNVPIFQQIRPVTLFSSMHSLSLRLWDEKQQKLVGFKGLP